MNLNLKSSDRKSDLVEKCVGWRGWDTAVPGTTAVLRGHRSRQGQERLPHDEEDEQCPDVCDRPARVREDSERKLPAACADATADIWWRAECCAVQLAEHVEGTGGVELVGVGVHC